MKRRTRIKFCGMTRADDIDQAVRLGVDAIGLIFVPGSPRRLGLDAAARLRRAIPPLVTVVALVSDAEASGIAEILEAVRPQLLQFHGSEDPAFCASFGLPYLKAIAMGQAGVSLPAAAAPYHGAAGLILDGHARGGMGGQGRSFDWTLLREWGSSLPALPPILLAGGLAPSNITDAILTARPYAVDVSSGIEVTPGCKDSGKMADFVRGVLCADAEIPD